MPKKTRRILFLIAIAAFLAIGFMVIMYAQGYRWDFQANIFLLSGGIYLESAPKEAAIFLNDKPLNEQTPFLIKGLLPFRKYKIRLEKDGLQNWIKEFEIKPGDVAQAKNIILFPKEIKNQIVWNDAALADFNISPNEKYLALKTDSKLKIVSLAATNPLDATTTTVNFSDSKKTAQLDFLSNNWGWSQNSKKFTFQRTALYQKPNWYIWNTETAQLLNLTQLYESNIVLKNASASPWPTKFSVNKIIWLGNDNNIIILLNNRLFQIDLEKEKLIDLKLTDIIDFDIYENKIIALKKPDVLLLLDSAIQNVSVLAQAKFPPQKIVISPKGYSLAYTADSKLGIIWLKETDQQPFKKYLDQEIILAADAPIQQIYWHNSSEYVVLLANDKLNAIELDNRNGYNISSWPETIKTINYLTENSRLYFMENDFIKMSQEKF